MSGVDEGDLGLVAAEYVIGTLDGEERAAFAQRLATDAAAQRAVAAWEQHFAGLAGRIDPIQPVEEVWSRIERGLAASIAKMSEFKVIDGGRRPSSEAPAMRRSRNRWRVAALLSGAIAAALAIYVGDRARKGLGDVSQPDATYVAAVNRGGNKPALIVRVDLKTGKVAVRPVEAVAPEGKALELWYIGADKTPRSLGLVGAAPLRTDLPAGAAYDAATFAISVEPPGGSTTGGPTGPVVYSGQLVKE